MENTTCKWQGEGVEVWEMVRDGGTGGEEGEKGRKSERKRKRGRGEGKEG